MRAALKTQSKVGAVLRVTSGNFLEMFDFFLFGFYAVHISKAFFPAANEFASLLLTFVTFGAGFLMRPLGAIFLGAYVDRVGRRKGLIVTLSIMAAGTILIAFVPAYAKIGLAAPLLVLFGRLLQGFSAGVELGGVSVYLSEIATPGNKGFYVAWQSASQQLAIVAAAIIGYTLSKTLSPAEIGEWGWRIPILHRVPHCTVSLCDPAILGGNPGVLARTHRLSTGEIFRSIFENLEIVLAGMLLVIMTTVSFYLITVYTPAFGKSVLRLSEADSLIVTLCIGVSNFFWLPVMGALSDRTGRRPVLAAFTVLALLTVYPALSWLSAAPSFERMLYVELWLSFIYASYNGAMVAALTEVIPASVRTAGFSLAYSLATALGGFYAGHFDLLDRGHGQQGRAGAMDELRRALRACRNLYALSPG